MSEFRVDTITDRSGTGSPNFPNGLTLNGSLPVTNSPTWSETGTAPSSLATQNRIDAYNKGGKNLIINGNMNIHQRSGSSVPNMSTSGYYTADRWYSDISTASTSAVFSQLVDATDFPVNSEFRKCLKTTCTTAKASLAVGDFVKVVQKIEGQNIQVLKKGTSAAETMTISFWVESSLTGTYVCEVVDLQNSRQISKSYTVSSSGVWEQKTINFPSDTTGTISNDSSSRFEVSFWLSAGATYSGGTLNNSSWASFTQANRAAGQVNLASNVDNYFALTGVQLEVGSIANPYEYKSYSEQLILCQRYYQKSYDLNVNPGTATQSGMIMGGIQFASGIGGAWGVHQFSVPLRDTPSLSIWDGAGTNNVLSYTYGGGGTAQNILNGGAAWGTLTRLISSRSFLIAPTSTQANAISYIHFTANAELT